MIFVGWVSGPPKICFFPRYSRPLAHHLTWFLFHPIILGMVGKRAVKSGVIIEFFAARLPTLQITPLFLFLFKMGDGGQAGGEIGGYY
ncbi:MAG: hypothetical protein DRR16_24305 [Candidatus Parabeggiatoa sp. nov. 3]|nr:MAG: hypothetical protein DRR16_24305 [Gammaproteobacteria bacterium]